MPIAEDPDPRPSPDQPDQPNDPFANLVLDEEFVKGAAVKEQSGRARMLTAKWKREPPKVEEAWRPPTEIRRRRFGRRAKVVDPWGNPKRKQKRNWQTPVFVLLAGAVVLAGLNIDRLHSWYSGNQDSGLAITPATSKPRSRRPRSRPRRPHRRRRKRPTSRRSLTRGPAPRRGLAERRGRDRASAGRGGRGVRDG